MTLTELADVDDTTAGEATQDCGEERRWRRDADVGVAAAAFGSSFDERAGDLRDGWSWTGDARSKSHPARSGVKSRGDDSSTSLQAATSCMTSKSFKPSSPASWKGVEVRLTMPFETTKNRADGPPTGFFDALKTAALGCTRRKADGAGVRQVAIRFTAFERLKRALPGSAFVAGLPPAIEGAIWVAPTSTKMLRRRSSARQRTRTAAACCRACWRSASRAPRACSRACARPSRATRWQGVRFGIFAKVDAAVTTFAGKFHAVVAGGITGVMSTVVTNPIDVLKTRVQSAPLDADGRAAAVTLRGLVEKEGPAVLARGLGPRVVKIGLGQRSSSACTTPCARDCHRNF